MFTRNQCFNIMHKLSSEDKEVMLREFAQYVAFDGKMILVKPCKKMLLAPMKTQPYTSFS